MNIPRRIDLVIADQAYILDALMAYRNIVESGDCNNCKVQRECEVKPKPGQLVRYNCPFYQRGGKPEKKWMGKIYRCLYCS